MKRLAEFKVAIGGEDKKLYLCQDEYVVSDRIAVLLYEDAADEFAGDGGDFEGLEFWGDVSINVVGVDLAAGEFVLNHNFDSLDRVLAAVLATGKVEDTGRRVSFGFCVDRPVYRVIP